MRHLFKPWAVLAALAAGLVAPSTQAALIYDLTTSFGSGQIEFATRSGDSRSDVISFNFTAPDAFGTGPITYTENDINTGSSGVDWSIGPDGFVTSFRLGTNPDGAATALFLTTVGLSFDNCIDDLVITRALLCQVSPRARVTSGLSITPVAMPAPAGFALFGLGVLGLAVARRRGRRDTRDGPGGDSFLPAGRVRPMRHMLKLWALLAALTAGLIAPAAQAALIYDLTTDFGSGQIEFATLSGDSQSDVISFNFTAPDAFGTGPITYTKNDIDPGGQSVVWSIAPDGSVTSFRLDTNPDGTPTYLEFNTAGQVQDYCDVDIYSAQAIICQVAPKDRVTSGLSITPVAMPAPAGLALFGLAVAGLALARRRRRNGIRSVRQRRFLANARPEAVFRYRSN